MSIFKSFTAALPVAILALLLSGCPESDNYTQGLVQVAQTQVCEEHHDEHGEDEEDHEHDEEEEGHEHDEAEEGVHCGDEHEHEDEGEHEEDHEEEHSEAKVIEDAEGHSVELIRAYLVIDQIELLGCTNAATLIKRSVDGLLGAAWAQDGHDHGGDDNDVPDDQRNLNRPHVIDLMNEDEALLVLGNLSVEQGNYCGLRVSLVPAQDDAFGLPEDLSLIGTGFYLNWHQDIDGEESAMTVDSTGTSLPMTVSLDFEESLKVGADQHHVVVGINYAEIFEDIDLSGVTEAQLPALLLEGIEHALHIHDTGDGVAVEIDYGDGDDHDDHGHAH